MIPEVNLLLSIIPKEKKTITTNEIISYCFNSVGLPNSRTEVYTLISILLTSGVIEKKKNGLYEIKKRVL
jgi:hypothetical protein